MSVDALPYTVLLVLAEFTIGGLWVLWGTQVRGEVAWSFVKFCAGLLVVMAALTFVAAAKVTTPQEIAGYPLDAAQMGPARVLLAAFFALCFPYALLTLREDRRSSLAVGGIACLVGLGALALLARVFAPPTWGYAGVLLALVAGALAVGGVSIGMILGHWYLVTPRLPEKPLRELTAFVLLALLLQGLLLVPNLALPRETIPGGLDAPLLQSPFFWLRVAGGLALPLALTYMAYDSSGIRAMQSATGLLYIAMALVLAGEVLAKGLLFATALPS